MSVRLLKNYTVFHHRQPTAFRSVFRFREFAAVSLVFTVHIGPVTTSILRIVNVILRSIFGISEQSEFQFQQMCSQYFDLYSSISEQSELELVEPAGELGQGSNEMDHHMGCSSTE